MRLIDADKLNYTLAPIAPILVGDEIHWETIILKDRVDRALTVDAVPVIRCKDCNYSYVIGKTVQRRMCKLYAFQFETDDDGYCCKAERATNEIDKKRKSHLQGIQRTRS